MKCFWPAVVMPNLLASSVFALTLGGNYHLHNFRNPVFKSWGFQRGYQGCEIHDRALEPSGSIPGARKYMIVYQNHARIPGA